MSQNAWWWNISNFFFNFGEVVVVSRSFFIFIFLFFIFIFICIIVLRYWFVFKVNFFLLFLHVIVRAKWKVLTLKTKYSVGAFLEMKQSVLWVSDGCMIKLKIYIMEKNVRASNGPYWFHQIILATQSL